jgi:hypothetical protein
LSRLATSFILGFHGCGASLARKAVLEGEKILHSNKDYDWLGPGIYFWQSDPRRALEWARWKADRGEIEDPTVIGAVIDLGNCLDLTTRDDVELVIQAYQYFIEVRKQSGLEIPRNIAPKETHPQDAVLRYLDCAVLRFLHEWIEDTRERDPSIKPFDTVRALFVEGGPAYPGVRGARSRDCFWPTRMTAHDGG